MITKAYIISKEQNSNKYNVRIPFFEKPGINSENSNLSRTHFSATLAHEPTIFDTYNIGDCVFVGFENNELNRPVIIGKLYTKNDTSATSGLIETKVLTAVDKATLPADTTIDGINWQQVQQLFAEVDYINAKIDGKKTDVEIEYDGEIDGTLVSNVQVDIDNKSKLIVTKTTPSEVLTPEEREKINAIDLDGDGTKYLADDGEYKFLDLDSKVDKIPGKELSTNDYTTSEKSKLAGIESNAQVNIIEEIKVNNITQTPVGKSVNITTPDIAVQTTGTGVVSNIVVDSADKHKLNVTKQQLSVSDLSDGSTVATKTYVDTGLSAKVSIAGNQDISGNKNFTGTLYYQDEEVATKQDLSTVFKYKGSVASYANLPTSGNEIGDVWNVLDTDKNYAWNGTSWDDLGGVVDLSNYYTKTQIDTLLNSLETEIENIIDGTTTVKKAEQDSKGHTIHSHYVSRVGLGYNNIDNEVIAVWYDGDDNYVNQYEVALPKVTTTRDGLMSKTDKTIVDAVTTNLSTKEDKINKKNTLTDSASDYPTTHAVTVAIQEIDDSKVDYAPADGKVYGQQDNDWVPLEDTSDLRDALCFEGSWDPTSWAPRDVVDGGTI